MSSRIPTSVLLSSSLALVACGSVTTGDKGGQPSVATLMPDHGSVVGGTIVTLAGTNFGGSGDSASSLVIVGGHPATTVMVKSDTELTFVAPAGDQEGGVVDVTISNSNGFGSKAQSFTYNFKPLVASVTPTSGKAAGGTMITITGRGFTADGATAMVNIGGGDATNVTVVDDKTITAITGAITAANRPFTRLDVNVTNANGSNSLANGFTATTAGLLAMGLQVRGGQDTTFFYLDPATAAVTQISRTGHAHACAASPDGQIFAIGGSSSAGGQRKLVKIDPITGSQSIVGPLLDTGAALHNASSLVFVGGVLYGLDSPSGGAQSQRLMTIDRTTGHVTVIGATAQAVGTHAAIGVKDSGSVFLVDSISGTFDSMPVATSIRTAGPAMTGAVADPNGVRGLVNTGSALFVANTGIGSPTPTVYSVTLGGTAVLTPVAVMPITLVGLCQTPSTY